MQNKTYWAKGSLWTKWIIVKIKEKEIVLMPKPDILGQGKGVGLLYQVIP